MVVLRLVTYKIRSFRLLFWSFYEKNHQSKRNWDAGPRNHILNLLAALSTSAKRGDEAGLPAGNEAKPDGDDHQFRQDDGYEGHGAGRL